jgi:hypothetical protein
MDYPIQAEYIKSSLFIGGFNLEEFCDCVLEMNEYLTHVPVEAPTTQCGYGAPMSEDEPMNILDRTNPYE